MPKTGFLITNLGTPASPAIKDVRRYLKEFLLDGYVLDVPKPLRHLIVNGLILPFRPKKSAAAYASIWTERGSPLLLHSEALKEALEPLVDAPLAMGMRYGNPSLASAVDELAAQGVTHIVCIPLYPQYADSTVTTSIDVINAHLPNGVSVEYVTAFYDDQDYIAALAQSVTNSLPNGFDHLLMSYHGLPERHMKKADPTGNHCLQSANCCDKESSAHATCYRHQVFATSAALARALALTPEQYTVSFQSRLGGGWLQPYTDKLLEQLPTQGIKSLAVICPAFVADNLETLEEINIRGRDTFMAAGGESLHLIPCLNSDNAWTHALAKLLTRRDNTSQTVSASAETSA